MDLYSDYIHSTTIKDESKTLSSRIKLLWKTRSNRYCALIIGFSHYLHEFLIRQLADHKISNYIKYIKLTKS